MTESTPDTQFAHAEREPAEKILEQADIVRHKIFGMPFMQAIFDTIHDYVIVLNIHRQVVFANTAFIKLTGISAPDSHLGMRPGEALKCIHYMDNSAGCGTSRFCSECGAVKAILAALDGKRNTRECRMMQCHGSDSMDLLVSATPIVIDGDSFAFVSISEISHEKRRRALERVFFHDVLNTVGALMGLTTLLRGAEPEGAAQIVDNIKTITGRLVEEIQAQRALLYAENGELVINEVSIETVKLLSEISLFFMNQEEDRSKHIVVTPDTQHFMMRCDPVILRRVLTNMIRNALEASEEGGTVTVSCRVAGDTAEFSVHNDGVIPQNVQLQIFHRSFSTKGKDRGLGTYSMKLLTERYLRGNVHFTSNEKEGTTFLLSIPWL